MKILYLVDYYQPDIGYSEYYLPHELKKMGHEVTILTSNYYFPFPNYEASAGKLLGPRKHESGTYIQEEGIKVIKEKMIAEIFTRAIFGKHEDYVKSIKPDLVIVNKTAGWNAIRMAQLKVKYDYQLITYDAHLPSGYKAVGNQTAKNSFYRLFRLLFANLLNDRGDAHIAVQEGTVEIMHDYYGITNITHIPLGTDVNRFRRVTKQGLAIRQKFGISTKSFVIIYTGKIVPTKGVHILFAAFNRLAKKYSDVKLLLVGDGAENYIEKCLENLDKKYHDRVIWAGFQKNKVLYKYYSAANVGVWPLEESTSMNDAAACELPFIANDQAGVKLRFANNNAMVYRRGDDQDLADKLEFLIKNKKEAKAMGLRGRDLAVRELSWRAIATKYVSSPANKLIPTLEHTLSWLNSAQDACKDGGVSAYFSLIKGWAPSFIETTGYIIPTLLKADQLMPQQGLKARALRMGDFLLKMQLKGGGFRTYTPEESAESEPTVFNTAQDILGMTALYEATRVKKYLTSAVKAANFLIGIQDSDGAWRTYTHDNAPKSYHSRVAYALLEVYRLTKTQKYRISAKRTLDWVVGQQQDNGWVANAELPVAKYPYPLTHTISYVAEGLLYSSIILKDKKYQAAAMKVVDPVLSYVLSHKELPAYFDNKWQSQEEFGCPTGEAQFAIIMIEFCRLTGKAEYRQGAWILCNRLANVQGKMSIEGIKGGIPGCTPLFGDLMHLRGYCRGCYINWAAKYTADALMELQTI